MRPRRKDQDSRSVLRRKVEDALAGLVDPQSLSPEQAEVLKGLCERFLARSLEERRLVRRIKREKERLPYLTRAAKTAIDLLLLGLEDATPTERQAARTQLLVVLANKPEKPQRSASREAVSMGGRVFERPSPVALEP